MGKDHMECGQACGAGYWIHESSAMEPVVHSHEHGNKILIIKANEMLTGELHPDLVSRQQHN